MSGKKTDGKRDRIGVVLYLTYVLFLLGSVLLIVKIIGIQLFFDPDPKIEAALTPASIRSTIEPSRGNIIDCQGRLLAMSYPTYQFYMDCTVLKDRNSDKQEEIWLSKARALSDSLAVVFPDRKSSQFYNLIRDGRRNGKRYVKIGDPVSRDLFLRINDFPLFNEGQYKGGVRYEQENIRMYPYGKLARRTIGFVRNNKANVANSHIGLEGKYDYVLHGTEGTEWLRYTDYGRIRNSDSSYVKAVDGLDIRTTLNIDYQDIADNALRRLIENENDIEGACLVLMETSTGAVRAMVNLLRDESSGTLEEIQNLAVGRKGEPGSVFKTVTLASVLSDGYVKSLDETIPTNHGIVNGYRIPQDKHIVDFEREHHTSRISVLDGFKMSSNYVFASLAINNYEKNPGRFIDNIYSYKLADIFEFDLDGLATPTVPTPKSKTWNKVDLGVIGYGYTTAMTPLHVLTFYNAIANKGRMMRPYLVEDIEENGIVTSKKGPAVLNAAICTKAVADTLTRALLAVTEEGTARRLKGAKCAVAGKTGTAFILFDNGQREDAGGRRKYQGTFVGFFPAEAPHYSIICTVYSKPTTKSFQGGGIPASAVRELVDKLYNIDPVFRQTISEKTVK
ncbi:MAG: penicillin-binding protein 2 [Bacteroidales bacterium]|nr:penicillin-binding protein 2 [Bacteroidales bacterium]